MTNLLTRALASLDEAELRAALAYVVEQDADFAAEVIEHALTLAEVEATTAPVPLEELPIILDADDDKWYRGADGLYNLNGPGAQGRRNFASVVETYGPVRAPIAS
jgi:hypothetical protein